MVVYVVLMLEIFSEVEWFECVVFIVGWLLL